jgi:plastocyanin
MKDSRFTRNLMLLPFLACGVWGLLSLSSCDGGSSTGSGGNPTPREFASGDLTAGNPGESFTHVFNTAKTIGYYCRHHGGSGGVGMSGVITVNAGGTPNRIPVNITSSTLPDLSIDVMDTVVWTNNHTSPYPTVHTVESDN